MFLRCRWQVAPICALVAASLFTSCEFSEREKKTDTLAPIDQKSVETNALAITESSDDKEPMVTEKEIKEPSPPPEANFMLMSVYLNPLKPQNEVYLGDWRLLIFGVDDEGRKNTGYYYSMTDWSGNAVVELSDVMHAHAMAVVATNEVVPFACDEELSEANIGLCRQLSIFIPPHCFDKTVWTIGLLENAVWDYYRNAALRHGEGWNTTQVDCGTWLANLNQLYLTEEIVRELDSLVEFESFRPEALHEAFRTNQQFLTPTRPPICMAEQRHSGGTMNGGDTVRLPHILGDHEECGMDTITIGTNGIITDICGTSFDGNLSVNNINFFPTKTNRLQDETFSGIISHQRNTASNIDVSVYNTQLGNGRPLDSEIYRDACAVTSVVKFDNTSSHDNEIMADVSGITFRDLFGPGQNTAIYLTSDGDNVVSEYDFWVIFYETNGVLCEELVMVVELLGHRQGDFRDNLIMAYDEDSEDLFLGLRADYELDDSQTGGSMAFLSYTIHMWDGTTIEGQNQLRQQFSACYLASDPWEYQFFRINDSQYTRDLHNTNCAYLCPLQMADFAAHSQCFSNSRSNQRWQNIDAGLWSMNSTKNVNGNVIINPGWLAPHLDFEVYLQKFDEAVFTGPLTIRTTDEIGQLSVELPTVVEGDRVFIKAQDNCCEDYKLILPCVPEFTGFTGIAGVPYIPQAGLPPAIMP